jgi:hypothetical protein
MAAEGGHLRLARRASAARRVGDEGPERGQKLLDVTRRQSLGACCEEAVGRSVGHGHLAPGVKDHDGLGHGIRHRLEAGCRVGEVGAPLPQPGTLPFQLAQAEGEGDQETDEQGGEGGDRDVPAFRGDTA